MARGKPRTLLIDGDILFYKAAAASQGTCEFTPGEKTIWADEADCIKHFERSIEWLLSRANFVDYRICLTDHVESFRKDLASFYKANRNGVSKPTLLRFIEAHAVEHHPTLAHPRLEADDVLGIHATAGKLQNPVIVSADKDLRQIPGEHLVDGKITIITPLEGHTWHLTQTIIGDPTDGYKGLPGAGPKAAARILDGHIENHSYWPEIVAAYEAKGLTEDDALLQARLAYILQAGDYRERDSKIKLWKPPA